MFKYLLLFVFIFIASCVMTGPQSRAERPRERQGLDLERSTSDLVREEESSPTSASNVDERYRKLMNIVMAMIKRNMLAKDILPQEEGRKIESLLRTKELEKAAPLVSEAIHRLPKVKAPEEITGKETEKKPSAFQESVSPQPTSQPSNRSYDADKIFWGTEASVQLSSYSDIPDAVRKITDAVNNDLKTKYVKIRLQQIMVSRDGKSFTPDICLPSQINCRMRFNLDETVKLFKANNWSMIPMLSHDPTDSNITNRTIDSYVDFVDWFISRYKGEANIKYVELINAPGFWWKGTKEQLLELNNKVYERLKPKYPDIMLGTPGFEYMIDTPTADKSVQEIEFFLNKNNGARFDFWAFHGYPLTGNNFTGIYPPTKIAINNKYGGIPGILEIRKKLDANGWQNVLILDTEHTGTVLPKPTTSDEEDDLNSAYTIQELLLKRTLKVDNRFILSGIITLKMTPRGNMGEFLWGSLRPDASLTKTVKAVSLLLSKFNEYQYSSRINGDFDNENQEWVEKFQSANKELYIFFKPFRYQKGQSIRLDNQTINFTLNLDKKPNLAILTDITGKTVNINPNQILNLEAVNSPKFLEVSY